MPRKRLYQVKSDDRLNLLFRSLGLSEKQARLYQLLLTDGPQRPAALARKSGLKRGNTYALLADLARLGLAFKFEKDKVIYFRPEPPLKLLELVSSRQNEANIARELSADLYPQLNRQYQFSVGKPVISYYEGEEGLQRVFADIYAPKSEPVWGCVDLEIADQVFPQYIAQKLIPLRIKNKLFAYSLVADSEASRQLAAQDVQQLRQTKLLSKSTYPLPAEIDIYEDKIAMLSFAKNQFIGLVIQNQAFAQSLKSIFKLSFPPKADARAGGDQRL